MAKCTFLNLICVWLVHTMLTTPDLSAAWTTSTDAPLLFLFLPFSPLSCLSATTSKSLSQASSRKMEMNTSLRCNAFKYHIIFLYFFRVKEAGGLFFHSQPPRKRCGCRYYTSHVIATMRGYSLLKPNQRQRCKSWTFTILALGSLWAFRLTLARVMTKVLSV